MSTASSVPALRAALKNVDAVSAGGMVAIETMARLALHRLESPEAYRSMHWLSVLLEHIAHTAADTSNVINAQAEQLGCVHGDEAAWRRSDAERLACGCGPAANASDSPQEVSHGNA